MKPFFVMLKTQIKLSLRGMDMFIFAICMPVVVLVLLGIIYGNAPAFDGADYSFLQQSFGALCTISLCAGGVMGLPLVVSGDRSKKILKRYRVTPISPALILAVHVAVYALYSLVSFALLYAIATLCFGYVFPGSWLMFAGAYLLVMLSIFSIGLMVGGIARDTKAAGAIASLLYFPMLIFSGATLPYEVMPVALQRVADVMPLTQGIKLLKSASLGLPIGDARLPILIMVGVAAICIGISLRFFKWE